MTQAFLTIAGNPATSAVLHMPSVGPWFIDAELEQDPDLSGSVECLIGRVSFRGTVIDRYTGAFGLQTRTRIVGGANGWGRLLGARNYHNDAGVRARLVVEDLVREAGETLGSFAVTQERVGIDYVRQAGLASRSLEETIGTSSWWVDERGETHVGTRATGQADASRYEILDYDPKQRLVTIATDDVSVVRIGSILPASDRFAEPQTVRELEIIVKDEGLRVMAWCGEATRGRLAGAMQRIVERLTDQRLFGLYRYRFMRMSSDRIELQAVSADPGLPDMLPISMFPGVAGTHAELTVGATVLVQFIEGKRTQPIATHFAGKDGTGWTPVNLTLDATTLIKLGQNATDAVGLAPPTDSQFDDINSALDAFAAAVPVPNDGGAAIQAAFKLVWGPGAPPKPPSDVGATKVRAE
jgi:hypothetical protein